MPRQQKPLAEQRAEYVCKAFSASLFPDEAAEEDAVRESAGRKYHKNYPKQFSARSAVVLDYSKRLGRDLIVDHRARQGNRGQERINAAKRSTDDDNAGDATARGTNNKRNGEAGSGDLTAEQQELADWGGALSINSTAAERQEEGFEQCPAILAVAIAPNGRLKATGSLHFAMMPEETEALLSTASKAVTGANRIMEQAYYKYGELPALQKDSAFTTQGLNNLLSVPQSALGHMRSMLASILEEVLARRTKVCTQVLLTEGADAVLEQMKGVLRTLSYYLRVATKTITCLTVAAPCRCCCNLPWSRADRLGHCPQPAQPRKSVQYRAAHQRFCVRTIASPVA